MSSMYACSGCFCSHSAEAAREYGRGHAGRSAEAARASASARSNRFSLAWQALRLLRSTAASAPPPPPESSARMATV